MLFFCISRENSNHKKYNFYAKFDGLFDLIEQDWEMGGVSSVEKIWKMKSSRTGKWFVDKKLLNGNWNNLELWYEFFLSALNTMEFYITEAVSA